MARTVVRKKSWWRHRLLLRGESVVASTGLIMAAMLLFVMGATAYWTLRVQRAEIQSARTNEIKSLGTLLAETATLMLSLDELSSVRRLLVDTGRNYALTECRIVLPDSQIVADADPSKITLKRLAATWTEATAHGGIEESTDKVLRLSYPLSIPGRGSARLNLTANTSYPLLRYWEAQAGVGTIGASAMVALFFIYRHLRARVLALGMIRDVLLALEAGESTPAALALRDEFGPEAKAWNQLLTERERLEKELLTARVEDVLTSHASANHQLQEMCDAMRQGVILVDNTLRVTYANRVAAVFLCTTPDKIIGASIATFTSDRQLLDSVEAALCGGARSWKIVDLDKRGEDASGVLRFSVRPLHRYEWSAAIIVIDDVTQQCIADEARDEFITQVTHELRTPLTNIRLYAETAIEDGEKDPQRRAQCLNVITQEAMRLERVVADMLSVAEIEAGTLELKNDDVQLSTLVEELQSDYNNQAREKDITLELNLPPKLPTIRADRDKMALALRNVVDNAIKYTPQGGRVVVNVDVLDDTLTVDVIDNGIGIDEPDIGRIFETFYRAQDAKVADVVGSGLGLALAREIIRLHGGDIRVESEIDKGSMFSVTLPISAKAA